MNGISRPFDKGSSGFVRSEACCVLFLQKVDKARRVYATVLNSKSNNDGFKIEGPTVPSTKIQKELFRKTYEELNMNPHDVDFIEAHATSTGIGDKGEITSIDEYFCKDRKEPLMVGSVKGNMGHSEGASGAVSVAKSILMFETGKILPNINIDELRGDCPGLIDGRIKVMREVEDFNGKIIGVNSFGVLGANAHSVIKRNEKVKINGGFPSDNMPRLLLWAGRHVNAVNHVFDHVASKPIDDEFLALLQCSQIESSVATLTRGFAIFKSNLDDRSTSCIDRQVKELDKANRPVVFVYSGVGSQWIEMGRDLIKIPLVAESINKCHEILMKKGLNLKEILTSNSPDIFKSCLNIFVGVVSIQIALTDLLYKIGVKPNFFIGHSVGELACAYADGTLTLEQTILVAYSRGMSIIEGVKIPGMMAAVAMNYKDLKNILPHDIEIACHNSIESCTISGPIESVQKFVSEIKSKNVLAKIVDSSNVAFHSSLIANCGSIFADKLKNIIIDPKKRSSKWISTSINENSCDEYSSIDYHVNNMLSSVRFAEGLTKLPEDSLIIEIAPHGLLLPILKQSIPNGVSISLTQRGIEDGVIFLLQSLGKVYQSGVDLDIRQIYPKIDFPVSRGTPMISPLVKWLHDETFPVPMYDPFLRCDKRNLTINPNDPIYSIMKGHQLDGKLFLSFN
jgi:fatty acid synthase, animal type